MNTWAGSLLVFLLVIVVVYTGVAAQAAAPVALGKVFEGGYVVVYDDYSVVINGKRYNIGDIGVDPNTIFTVTYSTDTGDLMLAGFYNESNIEGTGYIIIYNIVDDRVVYRDFYKYKIDNGEVRGKLLSEAAYIPGERVIVSMYVNTTSAYIQVSSIGGEEEVYEAPAAFGFYMDNEGVYAALIKESEFGGQQVRLVTAVNLLTGDEVASYPSLIPVVDLAIPLVQLFKENGEWIGYVVVYNPTSGQLEYYRVTPGSLELPEVDPVTVSPDLRYAVKAGRGEAAIILPDGSSWSLGRDARPAPPTVYLGIEPGNSIVDIDENGVLMRITSGSNTSIIYRSWSGAEATIYTLPGTHNRLTGLYSILINGKVVILDPTTGRVIEEALPQLSDGQEQEVQQTAVTWDNTTVTVDDSPGQEWPALAALIAGVMVMLVVLWRRRRK